MSSSSPQKFWNAKPHQQKASTTTVILISLLQNWISIIGLANLDSAMCSEERRDVFLDCLGSEKAIFTGLKYVEVGASYLRWAQLRTIKITELNIRVKSDTSWVSGDHIRDNYQYLRCLKIDFADRWIAHFLYYVAKFVCALEVLALTNVVHLESYILQRILYSNRGLTRIDVSNSEPGFNCHSSASFILMDAHLMAVSQCGLLTELNLANNRFISDATIAHVLKHCVLLTELTLSGCVTLTNSAVAFIAVGLQARLRALDVSHCTKVGSTSIAKLSEYCPELRVLRVSHCHQVSNDALQKLAMACPHLTSLHLANSTDPTIREYDRDSSSSAQQQQPLLLNRLAALSCRTVFALGNHCHALTDLSLRGMAQLSDMCLAKLVVSLQNSLVSLDVSCCGLLTDATLTALAKFCRCLRVLSASHNPNFSDVGILNLSRYCQSLTALDMSVTPKLTKYSVRYLCEYSVGLKELSVSNCPQLNDDCLTLIGDKRALPSLVRLVIGIDYVFLSLSLNKQFTASAITRLKEARPVLTVVNITPGMHFTLPIVNLMGPVEEEWKRLRRGEVMVGRR